MLLLHYYVILLSKHGINIKYILLFNKIIKKVKSLLKSKLGFIYNHFFIIKIAVISYELNSSGVMCRLL